MTATQSAQSNMIETLEDRQMFSAMGTMNIIDAGVAPSLITSYMLNGVKDYADALKGQPWPWAAPCGRGGTSILAAVYAATLWADRVSLDAFSTSGSRNLSPRPGRWPGWVACGFWPRTLPSPQEGQRSCAALSNSPNRGR